MRAVVGPSSLLAVLRHISLETCIIYSYFNTRYFEADFCSVIVGVILFVIAPVQFCVRFLVPLCDHPCYLLNRHLYTSSRANSWLVPMPVFFIMFMILPVICSFSASCEVKLQIYVFFFMFQLFFLIIFMSCFLLPSPSAVSCSKVSQNLPWMRGHASNLPVIRSIQVNVCYSVWCVIMLPVTDMCIERWWLQYQNATLSKRQCTKDDGNSDWTGSGNVKHLIFCYFLMTKFSTCVCLYYVCESR